MFVKTMHLKIADIDCEYFVPFLNWYWFRIIFISVNGDYQGTVAVSTCTRLCPCWPGSSKVWSGSSWSSTTPESSSEDSLLLSDPLACLLPAPSCPLYGGTESRHDEWESARCSGSNRRKRWFSVVVRYWGVDSSLWTYE